MRTSKPEKIMFSELVAEYENGGYDFLVRIVTGNETWLHRSFEDVGLLTTTTKQWLRRTYPECYRDQNCV
jgi:hypothetical protein